MIGFERRPSSRRTRNLGMVGVGAAGMALAASSAEAAIISSGVVDVVVNEITANSPGIDLDIDGNSSVDFNFTSLSGKAGGAMDAYGENGAGFVGGAGTIDNLPVNELVNADDEYNSGAFMTHGQQLESWNSPNDHGYLGVSFLIDGSTHYGWVEVTANSTLEIVLNQWAYEDTPTNGILTGAVPEPTTGFLMLLGLFLAGMGLRFGRRRRRGTVAV
jgi:hypothetical protein